MYSPALASGVAETVCLPQCTWIEAKFSRTIMSHVSLVFCHHSLDASPPTAAHLTQQCLCSSSLIPYLYPSLMAAPYLMDSALNNGAFAHGSAPQLECKLWRAGFET